MSSNSSAELGVVSAFVKFKRQNLCVHVSLINEDFDFFFGGPVNLLLPAFKEGNCLLNVNTPKNYLSDLKTMIIKYNAKISN